MKKDINRLQKIFDKTSGSCHICGKSLKFSNYGLKTGVGSWSIDHSRPKAKGGTDHLNNLYASCPGCNLQKGTQSTRSVRAKNGLTRAPLSKVKRQKKKTQYTTTGALLGAGIGAIFGPVGSSAGAIIGGIIGDISTPK